MCKNLKNYTECEIKGFDLPNITRLVQFCPPDNLSMLAQHFGHAARDPGTTGVVILLTPKGYFEETCCKQEVRAKKVAERRKHNVPTHRGIITAEHPRTW